MSVQQMWEFGIAVYHIKEDPKSTFVQFFNATEPSLQCYFSAQHIRVAILCIISSNNASNKTLHQKSVKTYEISYCFHLQKSVSKARDH